MRFSIAAAALLALVSAPAAWAQGTVVELDGLKSEAPAGWKMGKADNKFRAYQFTIPKAGDDPEDAELVIFYFGAGSGGSAADNVKRWKGMFQAPAGEVGEGSAKVEKKKVGDVPVTYVDVRGTYLSKFPPFAPNAKTTRKEDYRLIGVVFESKDGPYFFRLVGPQRTVEQNKAAFDRWLGAFK